MKPVHIKKFIGELSPVFSRALSQQTLNDKFEELIPEEFVENCKFSNFTEGKLKIIAKNSIWATKIRYSAPNLVEKLSSSDFFSTLHTVEVVVNAFFQETPQEKYSDLSGVNDLSQKTAPKELRLILNFLLDNKKQRKETGGRRKHD